MITYKEMDIKTIYDRRRWEFNQRFHASLIKEVLEKQIDVNVPLNNELKDKTNIKKSV